MENRMVEISRQLLDSAIGCSDWDLGNQVLYDLCARYPRHIDKSEIIAKIWLIGRAYAAAIERRKNSGHGIFNGDDFYLEKVAPSVQNSEIDEWLSALVNISEVNENNLSQILRVHFQVTQLFNEISGLEKRSLASKYLHFHYPKLFFIYDSRAVSAVSHLSSITGRAGRSTLKVDNEYRKFCEKCLRIRRHVNDLYKIQLLPRELDNLLLEIEANI